MIECRKEFQLALKADLNKSPEQAWLTELNLVEQDIQLALDHLEEWSTPTSVGTDIVNLLGGGQSEIYHEPLGIIAIYGAWNYPFILTLQPIVGAIAAGNCVLVKTPSPKYSKHSAETMLRLCNKYFEQDTIRFTGGGEGGEIGVGREGLAQKKGTRTLCARTTLCRASTGGAAEQGSAERRLPRRARCRARCRPIPTSAATAGQLRDPSSSPSPSPNQARTASRSSPH